MLVVIHTEIVRSAVARLSKQGSLGHWAVGLDRRIAIQTNLESEPY